MLPRSGRILFFNSLILLMSDYADIVWGVQDNAVLMNTLQLLQNKAAKTILDRPFHSSVADALEALGWNLGETQTFSSLPLRLCVTKISAHSMDLLANKDVHGYDT